MENAERVARPYAGLLHRPVAAVAADLESFSALLNKWQRVQNLVSRETLAEVWQRHIADSLQILPLLRDGDSVVLDLGSGGGLPAIPLAIACKGGRRRFVLVEPNSRKASFLRTVARDLALDVQVKAARAEELAAADLPEIDVITSRALAPLPQLCRLAAPLCHPHTRLIFHKGREYVEELSETDAAWHYDVLVTESATQGGGVILELSNLRLRNN
jgi:16S rRNA (guanine527-N7)-methyltransferase